MSIRDLEALIERERAHNRARTRQRRERLRNRTDDELSRDQSELFPSGRAVCKSCGRSLPLAAFPERRHTKRGILPFCSDCHEVTE